MAYIVKREKTATGKNITINDVIGYKDLKLYGDTYQETYSGKNLFKPFSYTGTSSTVVFTYALDGSINCNGTASSTARSMVSSQASSYLQTITSGTYTISGSADKNIRVEVCNSSGAVLGATYHSSIQPTFTISSDTQVFIRLTIPSGVTLTNVKVYPQLEKGSTATPYEKYVGGYPSPNPEYPQIVQTVTGKQEVEVVGENIFVPTLTADGTNIKTKNCTVTLNADEYSFVASGTDMYFGEVTASGLSYPKDRGTLYEINDADTIYLYCTNSTFNKNYITWYDENKVSLGYNTINNSKTNGKKVIENAKYFTIRFGYGSAVSGTTYTTKVMVSRHPITDYVPYTSSKYELNLGKNLATFGSGTTTSNQVTTTFNNSSFTIDGTANASGFSFQKVICTLPAGTYTLSTKLASGSKSGTSFQMTLSSATITYVTIPSNTTDRTATFTLTEETSLTFRLYINNSNSMTFNNMVINVQVEKGSVVSLYSPYKTPIELCKVGTYQDSIKKSTGKNLFDKDNANVLNAYFSANTPTITADNSNRTIYISCNPNTTYTISKKASPNGRAVGTTSSIPAINSVVDNIATINANDTTITYTTNANAKYLVIRVWNEGQDSETTFNQMKNSIQIELGDTPTDIEPYGVGKWYISKKTGKVVFNGSETGWAKSGVNYVIAKNTIPNSNLPSQTTNLYCNYFKVYATTNQVGTLRIGSSNLVFKYDDSGDYLNNFKTWLSTHNTDVYYQLVTPTVEEITDEELINQLNAIELFEGINNISNISADLNGELEINYYSYTNYNEVIYSGDAKHKVKIKFNGTELQDADRYCEKITRTSRVLSQDGSKRFTLDNFMSQEITLILHDIDTSIIQDQVEISIGTLCNDNVYEYVPLGIFNIQDTPTTDKDKITIKLRDNRVKFDVPYNAKPLIDSLGGSATKKQILNDICTKSGVTNDVTTFLGEDDLIGTYDSTVNGNIYVIDIAEQAGLVPIITREGHLDFVNLQNSTIHKIPLSILEKYELGNSFEVKRIVFEDGIRKYQTSSDETLDTLYLNSANPYISSQEQINSIFSALENYKIDSVKTGKIMGDPAIDPWDLIQVYGYYTDLPNGNKQFVADENTIVFETLANQTMTYTGKIISTYDTQIGIEERKENVTIKNEGTYKKIVKAEIDQLNGSLTLLAQDLEENYSTTTEMNSAIQLSAQGIEQTVSQTYETKSDATSKLGEAKTYADDVGTSAVSTANNYTDGQLVNYSTTTEMNSAITQKANEITSTVAETYSTKVETTTAKDEAIASANSTTDDKLSSYSTTSEMNTEIQQTASAINTRINKISTNINEETGEVEKVTTSTGYTFDENGLSIEKDGSSFTSLLDNTGTYYKDNGSVVSQTTKDGTITKDMVLYGRYYYGVDNDLDVEHFTKDDAMFIAEMYEDGNGEVGFGHFLNNLGGN